VYIGKGFRAIEIRAVVETTLSFSLHQKPTSVSGYLCRDSNA
jgi:hypothetical protein